MLPKTQLKIDLLVTIGLVLLAILISLYFQVRFLTSTVFFFVIPAIFLLVRKTKAVKRILAGSLLYGFLFAFSFELLALLNNAWSWTEEGLIFPYFILGVAPVDTVIAYFLWTFFVFVFYEHFLEQDISNKISNNFRFVVYPALALAAILTALFYVKPDILKFNYAYLILGLLCSIPSIFLIVKKPNLLSKFWKITLFFIFLYLSVELTALKLGYWRFERQYLGLIKIFNQQFPFEELFFWILASTAVVLSYYEFSVDDKK